MSFLWPGALIALLAGPLLLAYLWWTRRQRRKQTVRVSSVALIRSAIPKRAHWKRRVPVALFIASLLALGFGAAASPTSISTSSPPATGARFAALARYTFAPGAAL